MALDSTDQAMVDKLRVRLDPMLADVRKLQTAINAIYELAGEDPPYQHVGEAGGTAPPKARFKVYGRGEFYGKQLATVVRQLIDDNGPLTAEEIHELMLSGGFKFEAAENKQVDNLKISLGKNTTFDKTSQGHYTVAEQRPRKRTAVASDMVIVNQAQPGGPVTARKADGNDPDEAAKMMS